MNKNFSIINDAIMNGIGVAIHDFHEENGKKHQYHKQEALYGIQAFHDHFIQSWMINIPGCKINEICRIEDGANTYWQVFYNFDFQSHIYIVVVNYYKSGYPSHEVIVNF
jgi:hypothetical protein